MVVASRCLTGVPCRYDGTAHPCRALARVMEVADIVDVCPEVGLGMPVPREPVRLVLVGGSRRLVQPSTGRDLTEDADRFSAAFLDMLGRIDGFMLKEASPSCGVMGAPLFASIDAREPSGYGPGAFTAPALRRHRSSAVATEMDLEDEDVLRSFIKEILAGRTPCDILPDERQNR